MNQPNPQPVLLYDGDCGICHKFIGWFSDQTSDRTKALCLPQQDPSVQQRFPDLVLHAHGQDAGTLEGRPTELVWIDTDGQVFRDTDAYLRVLDHFPVTRSLAKQLNKPWLKPMVRRAAHLVIDNRQALSRFLAPDETAAIQQANAQSQDTDLVETLQAAHEPMRCVSNPTPTPAPAPTPTNSN